MKLTLKSFSQEVDLTDLEKAFSFLVFEDGDSGQLFKLPVPQDTITALSEIIVGEGQEHTEHVEEDPEEEPEPAPIPKASPTPPGRKTIRQMPRSEDDVPNL